MPRGYTCATQRAQVCVTSALNGGDLFTRVAGCRPAHLDQLAGIGSANAGRHVRNRCRLALLNQLTALENTSSGWHISLGRRLAN